MQTEAQTTTRGSLVVSTSALEIWLVGWLVGWLLNGMSTQKGQFVPTVGEGNRLSRLKWPTRYNAYYLTLHDNNIAQFTVKHSSCINATTGYLIEQLTR